MDKKGMYIAPLAMALIVLLIIILIATVNPSVKQTIMDFLNAVFGGGSTPKVPINSTP